MPSELALIVEEVNQHGFFATSLDKFLPEIKSQEEQMYTISLIAKRLGLKVSFNTITNFCVFEQ